MFILPTFLSVYSVLGIVLNLRNAEMNKDIECAFFSPQVVQTPIRERDKQFTITMLHGISYKRGKKRVLQSKEERHLKHISRKSRKTSQLR